MEKTDRVKSTAFALAAAVIWGFAFAFQRMGAEHLEAFSFNFFRGILATAALGVLTLFRIRGGGRVFRAGEGRAFWTGGLVCGVLLFTASYLQQHGMGGTEAGTAGFLTALYIVLVPLFEVALLRRRVPALLWVSVFAAMAGLYLISVKGDFTIRRSDLSIMLCGVVFAFHILAVDRYVKGTDPVALCCVQFAVVTALSGLCALVFEHPSWRDAASCLGALAYVGVVSGGLGYGAQMAAQKYGSPVIVTLLTSTESLFSALGGALILGERLTLRQGVGCAVMFCAVLLAQIPPEWLRRPKP